MTVGLFFLVFIGLLICGLHIGGAFAFMATLPNLINPKFPFNLELVIRAFISGLDSFPLLAIPLFMLSGDIMSKGGVSKKLFDFFAYFIGNKTAGYPCTVVMTCLFYGAISGSAPATTAAVGTMTIPFLIGLGYDKVFSTALVAVAGGLGVIIPPSIPFIVYASSANASTADLFIAGIFPGVLIGVCLMSYAYYYCRKHGEDKEKLRQKYQEIRKDGFLKLFRNSIWALLTPVIILGSIYGGIASPTEAATMSVFYALFVALYVYRTLRWRDIPGVLCSAVRTYAPLLFIICAAVAFSRVLNMMRAPQFISSEVLAFASSPIGVLLIINLMLLLVGMVMDTIPSIMIFTPILLPVAKQMHIDPIHFGVIMVVNLAVGFVTPPMGINLFVASSITKLPVVAIAKKALPLIGAFMIALALITFIPGISLVLTGR